MNKEFKIIMVTLIMILLLVPLQNKSVPQMDENKINKQLPRLTYSVSKRKQPVASINSISYTQLGPITILSNTDFGPSGYNFPGSGTPSDPYLIDGYNITDSSTTLISISNTNVYFNISNCYLNRVVVSLFEDCILLDNVIHGTIYNNTISNGEVYLYSSHNNTVSNNIINNTEDGIFMSYSENNVVFNNTIFDCSWSGISLYYSCIGNILSNNTIYNCSWRGIQLTDSCSNNLLSDNNISNCDDGIYEQQSTYNVISGNTISDSSWIGIKVDFSSNSIYSGNYIVNCSQYGITLGSSNRTTFSSNNVSFCDSSGIRIDFSFNNYFFDNTIYNCSWSGIDSNTDDNNLTANTIFNCSDGIHLSSVQNNTLLGNYIYNCSWSGIDAWSSNYSLISCNTVSYCSNGISLDYSSDNNILSGNTLFNNTYGIEVVNSNYNNIFSNLVYNNSFYGLDIDVIGLNTASYNIVYWNNFYNNTIFGSQASDAGSNNNISYNYWHDLGGATVYAINGGNSDPHPLTSPTFPVVAIISPSTPFYGVDTISIVLTGNAAHYQYSITGDIVNTTWTASVNRLLTADGIYTLHAYGNNSLGNTTHTSFTFTIDIVAPNIAINSPNNGMYPTSSILFDYSVSDATVTTVSIYTNTIVNSSPIFSGFPRTFSPDGIHTITVLAVDQAGNVNQSTVIFSVDTTPPSIILEFPTNDTDQQSGTTIDVSVMDVFLDFVLYNWDGAPNTTWSGNYQTSLPTGEVQHILNVYANDSLGRWSSQVFTFTTDDTSPTVNITSPASGTTYNEDPILLEYTVSDGNVTWFIDGNTGPGTLRSGSTMTGLSDSRHNVTIVAVDQAGNIGKDTVIFTVESDETSDETSDKSSKDSSAAEIGSFPGFFTILVIFGTLVIVIRRSKKI